MSFARGLAPAFLSVALWACHGQEEPKKPAGPALRRNFEETPED